MSGGVGDDGSKPSNPDIGSAQTEAVTPAAAPTVTPDALAATVASTGDDAYAPTVTPATGGSQTPRGIDLEATPLDERGFAHRYRPGKELGAGGMGEVQLFKDNRVGRNVALKRLRSARKGNGDAVARFLREARVQAQLEHPAIVPVYDMGVGDDGAPYFTMKRLRGMTLEEILAGLARGDDEITATYSERKLLGSFSQVCHAVDFAHRHGVLHRDLKPNNIMLGSFGEVYVLDWGVARISGEVEADSRNSAVHMVVDPDGGSGSTQDGSVMGTPGYMAPEQMRGEVDQLDSRSDLYALGAILFEILAGEPLHRRSDAKGIRASTLEGVDARPSQRVPDRDVAPELEAICVAATALDPDDRPAGVRVMVERLEAYLDGDRDLARRRELAAEHAELAADAAERALARGDDDQRKVALREVGRALAFDPENGRALETLGRLMVEPPAQLPAEVDRELRDRLMVGSKMEARAGAWMYLLFLVGGLLTLLMGVKSWPIVGGMAAIIAVQAVSAHVASRMKAITPWMVNLAIATNMLMMMLGTRLFGPFILIPGIATVATISFLFHHELQRPWITISAGVLAIMIPAALEWTGVISPTFVFADGELMLTSPALELPPFGTKLVLSVSTVLTILMSALYIQVMRNEQIEDQKRVLLQRWQLRKMLPDRAVPPDEAPDSRLLGC